MLIGLLASMAISVPETTPNMPLYKKVADEFRADVASGSHPEKATEKNRCDVPLEYLLHAFATMESGEGEWRRGKETKNWTSLHPTSSKRFYVKWDGKSKTPASQGEVLRTYGSVEDGLYDTLYMYKYGYGCDTDLRHVRTYVYGMKYPLPAASESHARQYHANLHQIIAKNVSVYGKNGYAGKRSAKLASDERLAGGDVFFSAKVAEESFRAKIASGKFWKASASDNRCEIEPSRLAVAFYFAVGGNSDNPFGTWSKNPYRTASSYSGNLSLAMEDFMADYKFRAKCSVSKKGVAAWLGLPETHPRVAELHSTVSAAVKNGIAFPEAYSKK